MGREVDALLRQLSRAFDTRSWHGPNLMGSLRGVTPDVAAYRPQPGRHNIWELVVHAAYWKYRAVRLMPGTPPQRFELAGSDFFPRPAPEADWQSDVALLRTWHGRLCEAAAGLTSAQLAETPGRSEFDRWDLLAGVAAHDVYHAGQIRLLRRMAEAA